MKIIKNINVSYFFLVISLLFLCLVIFKSYSLGNIEFYKKYYFISCILIIFSFLSFFFSKTFKLNISITLISLIIGLYLVEIILIIILS